MEITKVIKPGFRVIGKLGSTEDGAGFIARLWEDANGHFNEVEPLAKKDESGALVGVWGAMSDMSGAFAPWEDGFTKGLYLAGVEACDDAEPPEGWISWTIPGQEYLVTAAEDENTFAKTLSYMAENQLQLVGAVHDFTDPKTGKGYMYFPIRKL